MAAVSLPLSPSTLKGREVALLLIITLMVDCFLFSIQPVPGYMDASYYYATGIQLAEGQGFNEPFLWNYLDAPQSLPHPSNSYWYPLASLVAATGMVITGNSDFSSARIVFFLIALLFPLAVANLSLRMTGRRNLAMVSGFLAIFCGYYLPFILTTDNYAIYLLIGAIYFQSLENLTFPKAFLVGSLAGLLNLARADGLLWLPLSLAAVTCLSLQKKGKPYTIGNFPWRENLVVIAGYVTTFGFWMGRNILVYGALTAPGSSHVLWMTNYNQLFSFTPGIYTFHSWLTQGWKLIVFDRLSALWTNLTTGILAQGMLFLSPFIMIGIWNKRKMVSIRIAIIGWLILLVSESFLFPYASIRGGFFHAGTAFQPVWLALAPIGIEEAGGFLLRGRFRRVKTTFLHSISIIMVCVLSVMLVKMRIIDSGWNEGEFRYEKAEEIIRVHGAETENVIVAVNPPAYNAMTGRSAIVIPDGDILTLLSAARRFQAGYVILEEDRSPYLFTTLAENLQLYPEFSDIGGFDGVRIYAISSTK